MNLYGFSGCLFRIEIIIPASPLEGCGAMVGSVSAPVPSRDSVVTGGFLPGGIHAPEAVRVWTLIGASEWVLKTLKDGYAIPFTEVPGAYEEKNNASALQNMHTVRSIVADMIASGIVEVSRSKPTCISPLGLVSTPKPDGSVKHRLIFDASRWVNLVIPDKPVKLSHLEKALDLTNREDFQTIFDLKSAYYHVGIRKDQQDFLGASITNSDGSTLYFRYKFLPFGLRCAVHCITKIWKPITAFLSSQGIRSSVYIDDGRLLACSQDDAEKNRVFVYNLLKNLGWTIESSKSDSQGESAMVKEYLGFIIDTSNMSVSASSFKLDKVKKHVGSILTAASGSPPAPVPVKELSSILGKIVALQASHGFLSRVCSRSGYVALESHVVSFGWKGKVLLGENCKRELTFFLQNADARNGSPIHSGLTHVRVDSIVDNPISKGTHAPTFGRTHDLVMVSDASDFKASIYNLHANTSEHLSFALTIEEQGYSSGMRELLAVLKTLQVWKNSPGRPWSNLCVYWMTDSTNVVAFLSKGSSKAHVQDTVFRICLLLQELRISIIPVHLLREDPRIQAADDMSKFRDSDDWSIDDHHILGLIARFGLVTDAFASRANARCERYYTDTFEEGCAGVNAFAQKWDKGMYLCPPIRLLPLVAHEVRRRRCEGIVVLPDWPSSHFFGLFFTKQDCPMEPFCIAQVMFPYIYQNQGASSALKGKTDFKFFALYFNTF